MKTKMTALELIVAITETIELGYIDPTEVLTDEDKAMILMTVGLNQMKKAKAISKK